MTTIVAKRLLDGSFVQVMPDGSTRQMQDPTEWAAADAMSDEEITAAAMADPDAQPLPDGWIEKARLGPHPRLVRLRLRLSQQEFSARYQIPMETLVDWESRKAQPDDVVRAYMKVIMADPEGVAKAIAAKPLPVPPRAAE